MIMETTLQIENTIKANVPVLLEGRTGTGKTWLIRELADKHKKQLHVINVSGELTVDSILGQQTLIDGTVHWRDGVLTRAMREGDWVLFDELNTALPEVLTIINGVLDDMRAVTLPNADNERVCAHEGFRFIGTQNPANSDYAGTARLNEALLNRMVRFEVGYMSQDKELEAIKKHTKLADSNIYALTQVAQYSRNHMDVHLSTRDLVKVVRLRDNGGMTIKDAMSLVCRTKYDKSEYNLLESRYSEYLNELTYAGAPTDRDLTEHIRNELLSIKRQQAELEEQKRDLKKQVKKELIEEMLNGKE